MTVLAIIIVVVSCCWAIVILHHLKERDGSATAFATELQKIDEDRRVKLARVKKSVDAIAKNMELGNSSTAAVIADLQELEQQAISTNDRDRPPAMYSTDVLSVATRPLAEHLMNRAGTSSVITTPGGRVPEDYSAAKFRNTVETVQGVRANHDPHPGLFPRDPDLPVHFIIPALGRPDSTTSAKSVVATEDHDAALSILLAVLTRWPDTRVERGRVSPVSTESEWMGLSGHICTFCRGKRNPLTKALLEHESTRSLFHLTFPERSDQRAVELNGVEYGVPANEQLLGPGDDGLGEYEDIALVARLPNPWYPPAKALVIAGTRAYGTWGAAEYLRQHWGDELMDRVGRVDSSQPIEQRDFACVLRVRVAYGVESESEACLPVVPLDRGSLTVQKLVPELASGSIEMLTNGRSAA